MYKKKRCECGNKLFSRSICCSRCLETLTRLNKIADKSGLKQMIVMAYRDIPDLNVARYFLARGISFSEANKQMRDIGISEVIRSGIINTIRDLEIVRNYSSVDSCTNWAITEKD